MNNWKEEYRKLWIKNPTKQKDIEALIEKLLAKVVIMEKPRTWRKGQTLFNLLEWMGNNGHAPRTNTERLSDPFHITDDEFDRLYEQFMEENN